MSRVPSKSATLPYTTATIIGGTLALGKWFLLSMCLVVAVGYLTKNSPNN